MLQLLIVDDEQVERDGMKAILHQSFPSLLIQEARNGRMAIQLAKKLCPDLILMDIKMPGMNGLETLKRIMSDCPNAKFIMVTAYDTFDYMRQAIQLGATDYLLKPSKASDIIEIVGGVLKQIVIEQKERAKDKQQQLVFQKTMAVIETDIVTQLLYEHVHEVHFGILVDILNINTACEMFVVNVRIPVGSEHFYAKMKEKIRGMGNSLVGALHGNQLPIIVFRHPKITFRSQASLLAREILSVKGSQPDVSWTIGIGNVYSSLEHVRKSHQESLFATMEIRASANYRFYSELPIDKSDSNEQQVKDLKKELPDLIKLAKWDQVRTEVMSLIHYFETHGINPLQTQQRILEIVWGASRVLNDLGIESNTPFYSFQTLDYRQLRSETGDLLDQMRDLHTKYLNRLEADNVEQIKQYIMENSQEEISLETLSRKMGLSPIYISKIFKDKMGINYIDFLTKCRIEKAKVLLGDPNRSIKEIAIEVGYHEPNYFSKVFKKMVHVSPKDYQNTVLGKSLG